MSEGGEGRDQLLDGVLQEGEGYVRHGVHDLRQLSGEGQRQHGVLQLQEHSGEITKLELQFLQIGDSM